MNSEPLNPNSEAEDIDTNCDIQIVEGIKPPLKTSEVERAMREVGMTRLNVSRWKAQTTLAEFMIEIGAMKVAVGEYAVSNECRMEAIQKCRKAIRKTHAPMELSLLTSALAKLLDGKDKTTKETIGAIEIMRQQSPEALSTSRLPPKGSHIIAVQVNNKS
jgi:hypothetical protein